MIAELEEPKMKIRVFDLKDGEVKSVSEVYDPKSLDLEFVDLKYLRPLQMEGTVEKAGGALIFRGRLESDTELTCGRCLKKIERPVDKDFELFFEIKGEEDVDATDELREVLLLDHQIAYVCQENCKGLCTQCGANLNETKCGCRVEEKPIGSAFAELKKIWNRNKKREE